MIGWAGHIFLAVKQRTFQTFLGHSYEYYVAFLLIVLNFLVFVFARPYYKFSFAITLVLGLFGLAYFTPGIDTIILTLGRLEISFQPIILVFIALTYLLNMPAVHGTLRKMFEPSPEEAIRIEADNKLQNLAKFKEKFQYYSIEKLQNVIDKEGFVEDAKEAARQLLQEKQQS
ncbi:MAG: hypothetical protein RL660_782 [Bacteroidota bacterium]